MGARRKTLKPGKTFNFSECCWATHMYTADNYKSSLRRFFIFSTQQGSTTQQQSRLVHSCADTVRLKLKSKKKGGALSRQGSENETIYIQELSRSETITQTCIVNLSHAAQPHLWCTDGVCKLSRSPSCSSSSSLRCNLPLCLSHPSCPTFFLPLIIPHVTQQISLTLPASEAPQLATPVLPKFNKWSLGKLASRVGTPRLGKC